jgi:Flp pilus assembly protein TadB
MKKQCNLCGLRNDTHELGPKNMTWCLVLEKEVENKQVGCEHFMPESSATRNKKVEIANEKKRGIQSQTDQEKREKFESELHVEGIKQQELNRQSAERIANRAFIISIISALVALASCIAAWIAVYVK